MECGCSIDLDSDNGPQAFKSSDRKARKQHVCGECNRDILPGETYRYESGIWEDGPEAHKTCTDCLSVRSTYFCGYGYGETWNDLSEKIEEYGGEGFADSRLSKLTPRGREMVCALIEAVWLRKELEALPDNLLGILEHALGLDKQNTAYRNSYTASFASTAYDDCFTLVDMGLMRHTPSPEDKTLTAFCVTEDAKKLIEEGW